jgi:DNA-3-methyladenine glycosylase II
MQTSLGNITPQTVSNAGIKKIQAFGMSFRKAEYIYNFAEQVASGQFDLERIRELPDDEAIKALSSLKGIGVWTAEMILLFSLERPDILSYDDLAIQRGLRMIYHHRRITRPLFEKYRRRFSPYGSIASLYI